MVYCLVFGMFGFQMLQFILRHCRIEVFALCNLVAIIALQLRLAFLQESNASFSLNTLESGIGHGSGHDECVDRYEIVVTCLHAALIFTRSVSVALTVHCYFDWEEKFHFFHL